MTLLYQFKNFFAFTEIDNKSLDILDYFRVIWWVMLLHLILVLMNKQVYFELFYGPFFLCVAYKLLHREITKKFYLIQLLPFLILIVVLYLNSKQEGLYILACISAVSLSIYSAFFMMLMKEEKRKSIQNMLFFGWLFLSLLAFGMIMTILKSNRQIPLEVESKIVLIAMLVITVISITRILLHDKYDDNLPLFLDHDLTQTDVGSLKNAVLNRELIDRIENYFNSSNHFLNPSFDMEQLCLEVDIPKPVLSAIINKEMNKNFYLLLAEHRINHAKNLLIKQDYLFKIESVIYECGFNSKSSFHKYFKQFVGTTPSGFRYNYPRKEPVIRNRVLDLELNNPK